MSGNSGFSGALGGAGDSALAGSSMLPMLPTDPASLYNPMLPFNPADPSLAIGGITPAMALSSGGLGSTLRQLGQGLLKLPGVQQALGGAGAGGASGGGGGGSLRIGGGMPYDDLTAILRRFYNPPKRKGLI
jgi:hypothetical protein